MMSTRSAFVSEEYSIIMDAISDGDTEIAWHQKSIQRLMKRAFDIVAATLLLVLSLPIIILVALLVRLTSKGPVLLAQTRIGLNGVPYCMYKFRSMRADLPDILARGSGEVTCSDPRLTPIGGWIRAWRLDELPQLIHVLSGKMSLVGPRPDIPENLSVYSSEQMLRFAMPPGCTAWTFTRGAFANDWNTRQHINVEYVKKWSFWLDLRILGESFLTLLSQKNANPESGAM